jgi:ABC-type transport system substrate-binding protein
MTREMSFRKGESDLMLTQAAKGIAGLEKDGFTVARRMPGSGGWAELPDSANPKSPWADLRVRQAASYAIDKEAIVKALFYGEAEPAYQYGYKGHWAYNPSVIGYPYNPAKAKQLLAEAGYPNGFKTKVMFITNPDNDQVNTAIQGYFKAVGIDLELDPAQRAR